MAILPYYQEISHAQLGSSEDGYVIFNTFPGSGSMTLRNTNTKTMRSLLVMLDSVI